MQDKRTSLPSMDLQEISDETDALGTMNDFFTGEAKGASTECLYESW